MRPNGIVVTAPTLDYDLGFPQRVEDLAIEQFVTQAGIEALDVAVLPRTAGFDVGRLRPDCADPVLHRLWRRTLGRCRSGYGRVRHAG